MENFLDICQLSLTKTGEELCGDKVKTVRGRDRTIIVLSDGLGSGVKANILSTLTTELLVTLVRADLPLEEVMHTVIGTLPLCKVRKVAYATFTILEIRRDGDFRIVNFNNPLSLFFRGGRRRELERETTEILGRQVVISRGHLERGDFLALFSDGVLYAGLGVEMDFGWGRDNIAKFMEGLFLRRSRKAESVVRGVLQQTRQLYRDELGDDATLVGVYVREKHPLLVFTGPPLDDADDARCTDRVLHFAGRRVICGGTTANIVAAHLGERIEADIASMRPDVPPIGSLSAVDLVTEGIFTMARALDHLRAAAGDPSGLPSDRNGAVLLARELLLADTVEFLVGLRINEFYQNPLLPRSISIRRQLVEEIAQHLQSLHKQVRVEYC